MPEIYCREKSFAYLWGDNLFFLTPNFLIMKHLDFFKRCGSARLWCLLALVALTANVAKADLIFSESFDYTAGQLSVGRAANCNDSTKWWTLSGWYDGSEPNNPIQVVEGSLSYEGYTTSGIGNKAKLQTVSGTKDVRRFKDVTTGSIFIAAIVNVSSATTSADYFFGVCDGGANYYGKVFVKSVDDGFQLSIAKNTETKTSLTYTSTLKYNTNYLIVEEYVIKDGTKNDSVNLWVNPTKSTTTPTLVCNMELANAKADPSKIAGVYLIQTTNAPTLYIDEIKVATAWADLFESGSTPEPSATPTIKPSTTTLAFGSLYQDATSELKFTVSGVDLTADITLASSNDEVVLNKTTIAQADAAAEGGVEVTATLTAATAGTQTATITLSSTGATDVTINASWTAVAVTKVSDIAALKAGAGTDPEVLFLYTGEAVITYYEMSGEYSTPTFYVEDATGAVRIYDYFSNTCKVGDRIKDFTVVASSEELYRGLPFSFTSKVTIVSSGNEWTPQVVTLKELQDNHDDYLLELVKVEDVTLDLTETTYKAGNNTISQDGIDGAISLTSDNTLVGTAKPAKADVVGISYFTSGYNIRVRMAADIVAKSSPTTGLCRPAEAGQPLCYTTNGQLYIEGATGEVAIYNLTGICVAKTTVAEQATIALPQGVYAVKVAGSTHKIVVK